MCDRFVVVRYGQVVETGTVRDVFAEPQSDYTHALLDAVPALGDGGVAANDREEPILEVRGLTKRYGDFEAVRDISFSARRGTCVGLVGESGSGKSTVAMSLLRLNDPVGGAAFFEGDDILAMSERAFHPLRNRIGVVFQNPYSSLNPRMRVRDIISEPLETHTDIRGAELAAEVEKNIKRVGLDVEHLSRFPTDFSGGQRQRIAIARALAPAPDLLILDEPTAALDVSVQAQVLDLLEELQRDLSQTYLFITHDLAVVERLASDVIVMYRGGIMEQGPVADVFANPKTQYTRKLLASVPKLIRQPA
ncbi:MAG: ATP-binding cassette domain-containing protein [Candidatus Phaeomarinobacter sp.]